MKTKIPTLKRERYEKMKDKQDWSKRFDEGCYKWFRIYPDWVNDEIGTVLMINDYFFDMRDIITALRKNVTRKKLFEWYDYSTDDIENRVNFSSFIKGMR